MSNIVNYPISTFQNYFFSHSVFWTIANKSASATMECARDPHDPEVENHHRLTPYVVPQCTAPTRAPSCTATSCWSASSASTSTGRTCVASGRTNRSSSTATRATSASGRAPPPASGASGAQPTSPTASRDSTRNWTSTAASAQPTATYVTRTRLGIVFN